MTRDDMMIAALEDIAGISTKRPVIEDAATLSNRLHRVSTIAYRALKQLERMPYTNPATYTDRGEAL